MLKVLAQRVSQLWATDQKLTRLIMSETNLAIFEAYLDGFIEHILTYDEYWVHHFELESKQ